MLSDGSSDNEWKMGILWQICIKRCLEIHGLEFKI